MKLNVLKLAKWTGILFGVALVFAAVSEVVDPGGAERRMQEKQEQRAAETAAKKLKQAEEAAERKKAQAAAQSEVDPVFKHGFAVGFAAARSGSVKPTADQLDAHARRAATHLGEQGGMGFKMQWKNGFWAGWSKGD